MRESNDPEHLINNKNAFGLTPLYIACKNGHENIVKYLIEEKKANFMIKSNIGSKEEVESNIEVASRFSILISFNDLL